MRRGGRGRRRREGHASALRVAADLGEDGDWLSDVANEMEPEEGLFWVYGPGGERVMAFSDDGEELKELIALHKAHPDLLRAQICLTDAAVFTWIPCIRLRPQHRGRVWSYDLVEDQTHNGRKCRIS